MPQRFIGVYSFPKSGSTWMRHIISASVRQSPATKIVPDIYDQSIVDHPVSVGGQETFSYKSHSKLEMTKVGGRTFRNGLILYIVRHPLDVFLSQLNHVSENVHRDPQILAPCVSVEDVVARGDLPLFFWAFCVFETLLPTFSNCGSWFENTSNWRAMAEAEPDRVLIVRYEDLVAQGAAALGPFARQVGWSDADVEVGFKRANASTKPNGKFFWKQVVGNYRNFLPDEMIDRFYRMHGAALTPFGYTLDG
jgi:hypothetical protein